MPRRLELIAGISVLAGNAVVYAVLIAVRLYGSAI
jgi:hypothetical protein